jgi:hypothetical protein
MQIRCRGLGCGTGDRVYANPVSATPATTVDELVTRATECVREYSGGVDWWCFSFIIHGNGDKKNKVHFIKISGQLEDIDVLKKTVAEVSEDLGPIQSIMLCGSLRGSCRAPVDFRAGETMLDCLRRGAPTGSGFEAAEKSRATARRAEDEAAAAGAGDAESIMGEVTFDDTDGDTSTLRMTAARGLSWHAGGHCLIECVSTLRFNPEGSTLTCPQPIRATPFTGGKVWDTLTAVLQPGPATDELLGRIKAMVENSGEVAKSIEVSF